ncbi:MAG: DUF4493 domain-containing protein [Muribaculaceae bacterium]|nr:DUF4493 domain-containing protein [Muribaculaceae bacterium]
MKKIAYIFAAAIVGFASSGCSDEYSRHSGEGRLMLTPAINTELRTSRAFTDEEQTHLSETCKIWISSDKGLVREFDGIPSVPTDGIWLQTGSYMAEAWAGDSVPASFTERYFKGVKRFIIEAGTSKQVKLTCTLANSAVSVLYDKSVDLVLTDLKLTVGHSCGELEWVGKDDRLGYFMMNSRDKDLTYKLTGKDERGRDYEQTGVIKNCKPGINYVLNVSYTEVSVNAGGAYFDIVVDEDLLVVSDEITIMSAPQVTGIYQSLDEPYYAEKGSVERQGFFVTATKELVSVIVKVDGMDDILAETGANNFDILYLHETGNDELHEILRSLGIRHDLVRREDSGDDMKITFEPELLNRLDEGEYKITISATDEDNKTGVGSLDIIITDAVVDAKPIPADAPTTWATEATLTGTVMKANAENVGFNYRVKGESDWTFAAATPLSRAAWEKGAQFTVVLTGLVPGATYEYVAAADDFISTTIHEFTTEARDQLPNSGFEDWFMEGNVQRIYKEGGSMFWDSGNKGSAIARTTLTTPCESPKHGGLYSAKLASEKVSIAFAAGNLFVGEFLGTESLTKGILGWGRPWSTRPKALKGYVKYTPATISDVDGSPAGVTINKGDMDTGIIYIAILDDTPGKAYGSYKGWPQIVATKDISNYGFKPGADNVIAYGERVFTQATPGEDLIEFEIPLDYHTRDVKAGNIIVVASASRYGDYYTGGPSVMYLDDLELVY